MRNRSSDQEAFQTQFGAKAISCYPDRRLLRRYALPAPSLRKNNKKGMPARRFQATLTTIVKSIVILYSRFE